ncbi:hypothetical protein GCM10010372_70300 [Streptomyces tauricus]|nr:hypothetical protein GCM10010372_70300 [Streptomyces tauricus]
MKRGLLASHIGGGASLLEFEEETDARDPRDSWGSWGVEDERGGRADGTWQMWSTADDQVILSERRHPTRPERGWAWSARACGWSPPSWRYDRWPSS